MRLQRDAVDAIEWAAVRRGNGFRHLRASCYLGNANGLWPELNGAGCYHAIKWMSWTVSW